MDRIPEEIPPSPVKFSRVDRIELGSDGWLSPEGHYYKCDPTEHNTCASFLVANSEEVQLKANQLKELWSFDWQEYSDKPDRAKLNQFGWVLIRGSILHSENALNYSPEQLRRISEAGIKIVSAYEGGKEYSSKELLEKLDAIKDKLQQSAIIKEVVGQAPKISSFRKDTLRDIHEFVKDPLHKTIGVDEFPNYFLSLEYQEGGHEVLPSEIFDILSSGYSEEMVVRIGRWIRWFRLTRLEGADLMVQRWEYFHGGQSRDTSADIQNSISMFVVEPHGILEKFKRLIYGGVAEDEKNPKIELSEPNGYFAEITTHITS